MSYSRVLALVIVLVLSLGCCLAEDIDMTKTLDVTILPGAISTGLTPVQNTRIEQFLEEKFNLNITVAQIDWYNSEQRNIYIVAGNPLDMVLSVDVAPFVDIGGVRTITKEMIEANAPDYYADLIALDTGDMWKNVTFNDKIYGIPEFGIQSRTPYTMIYRSDWMEALGYSPDSLVTLEDYEELYLDVRNGDPDGNGEKDTYALGLYNAPFGETNFGYVFGYYGIHPKVWMNENGQLTYSCVTDGYRQALELLNRWYDMEIIDPDFTTDPRATTLEKFANSKLFSFEGFPGHIGRDGAVQKMLKDASPEATWMWLQGPVNEQGKRAAISMDFYKKTSIFFGAHTSDEKVARLMNMMNYLLYTQEGARLCMFGFEGDSFVINEDGTTSYTEAYNGNTDAKLALGINNFISRTSYPPLSWWALYGCIPPFHTGIPFLVLRLFTRLRGY